MRSGGEMGTEQGERREEMKNPFGPDLNILTIGWMDITFCTDNHGPQRKHVLAC